jgi:hypothetical protein
MVMLALDCAVKQWLNGSGGVRLMPQTGAGLLVNVFFEGLPERVAQLIRHPGAGSWTMMTSWQTEHLPETIEPTRSLAINSGLCDIPS